MFLGSGRRDGNVKRAEILAELETALADYGVSSFLPSSLYCSRYFDSVSKEFAAGFKMSLMLKIR